MSFGYSPSAYLLDWHSGRSLAPIKISRCQGAPSFRPIMTPTDLLAAPGAALRHGLNCCLTDLVPPPSAPLPNLRVQCFLQWFGVWAQGVRTPGCSYSIERTAIGPNGGLCRCEGLCLACLLWAYSLKVVHTQLATPSHTAYHCLEPIASPPTAPESGPQHRPQKHRPNSPPPAGRWILSLLYKGIYVCDAPVRRLERTGYGTVMLLLRKTKDVLPRTRPSAYPNPSLTL